MSTAVEATATAAPAPAATTTTMTTTPAPLATSSPLPSLEPPTEAFSFSHPHSLLTCASPGCNNPTHTTENSTVVICPRCSQYSYTRYCRPEHLLDPASIRDHFLIDQPQRRCGFNSLIRSAVDDSPASIPDSCLPPRAYIHEDMSANTASYTKNIIERHRQALWRSMGSLFPEEETSNEPSTSTTLPQSNEGADYYLFDDIDQISARLGITSAQLAAAPQSSRVDWLNQVRGLGEAIVEITIPSTTTRIFHDGKLLVTNLRAKFNETMDNCLHLGYAAGATRSEDCKFIYGVLRGELQKMGIWDEAMCEILVVQMGFEFGWRCPVEDRVGGNRQSA